MVRQRAQECNRIQNLLEDSNTKLASVAADILDASGRDMWHALGDGVDSAGILANMARDQLRDMIPHVGRDVSGEPPERWHVPGRQDTQGQRPAAAGAGRGGLGGVAHQGLVLTGDCYRPTDKDRSESRATPWKSRLPNQRLEPPLFYPHEYIAWEQEQSPHTTYGHIHCLSALR